MYTNKDGNSERIENGGRCIFRVGGTYAVTPGRGKRAVGRVVVTRLRIERLSGIGQESVVRECFGDSPMEYMERFRAMHGRDNTWDPWLRVVTFRLHSVAGSCDGEG